MRYNEKALVNAQRQLDDIPVQKSLMIVLIKFSTSTRTDIHIYNWDK